MENKNPHREISRPLDEWPWDPRRALRLLALKSREIGWITLAATVAGLLFAFLWPATYESQVVLKLPTPSMTQSDLLRSGIQVPYPGASDYLGTFTAIAQSVNVAEKTSQALGLKDRDGFKGLSQQAIDRKLFKMVTVARLPASNLFQIKAKAHNARFAADLATAWANAFMQENLDLSHQVAAAKKDFLSKEVKEYVDRVQDPNRLLNAQSKSDDMVYKMLVEEMEQTGLTQSADDSGMVIMTAAEVPEKPLFPRKTLTLLAAFLLGLVLGIQWVFLCDRLHPTVREESALTRLVGLPSLAIVPDCKEWEKHPSDFKAQPSAHSLVTEKKLMGSCYAQSVRLLSASLTLRPEGMPKTIGIFSPGCREGRTLACANLALELSRAGRRVLLVDADLRHPAVGKLFGIGEPEGGLTALLEGSKASGFVVPSGQTNLWLLPNPTAPANPSALLQGGQLEGIIRELSEQYDHVIFDTPPALDSAEALALSARLEGALLLARWDATSARDLSKTTERLRAAGAPLMGSVLNGVHPNKGLPSWADLRFGRWLWDA